MFSKNNKISKRQIFRLLTYDLLGIGTLLLPPVIAGESGKYGMISIVTGMGMGVIYAILLGKIINKMEEEETYPAYLKRCFGKGAGTLILLGYIGYYLCLAGYTAYIFGHLMITELLKNQSFYWIVAGILLLAIYGIVGGIEGRARVYEILFWILLLPLFVLLIFAARDVEIPRLFPWYGNAYDSLIRGGYYSFEVFSLSGFALFLTPFAKKKESIGGACVGAVVFSGIVLVVLYGISQGIFGIKAMENLEYPAVTLMSMIQIPGGFFQRQDALMVAIWFFTVFALLGSSLFYGVENLKALTNGKGGNLWMGLAGLIVFGISVLCYRSGRVTEGLHQVFLRLATPFVVVVPLAAIGCNKFWRKSGKKLFCGVILGIMVSASFMLVGCSTTELENRNFPLAMGVDKQEDSCRISYKFQNLSAVANQNTDSPSGTDFYIEDKDFFTGISKYANETNKIMDYNHMKVLILSEDYIEDTETVKQFLRVCGKEELIARNTLLFLAEDAAQILSLDANLDTSIGTYLEEMIESREDYHLKNAVTLGDFMNDMANEEQLLLLPVLSAQSGLPVIRNYYAISSGEPKGEISIQEGILSYLTQGKLKKLAFTLDDHTGISINHIRVEGSFSRGEEVLYHTRIAMEVVVESELRDGSPKGEDIQRQIQELMEQQLTQTSQNLLKTPGIDMTNSFYKLGMYDRDKYRKYRNHFETYLKDIDYEYQVEVTLLNERG